MPKTNKTTTTTKEKFCYVFFNCDEAKSETSKNIFYNNTVFTDTVAGKKALCAKLKEEIEAGHIQVEDMQGLLDEVTKGDPANAGKLIRFGDICKFTAC